MRKKLCLLLSALLMLCSAMAETDVPAESVAPIVSSAPEAEMITLCFEDGFSIDLPQGWLYYPVDQDMADQGVLYRLSDASAAHWLHIQSWNTDCPDVDSLKDLIDRASSSENAGIYNFKNADFVIYDLAFGDVSCCATLLDGRVLNFVFTPQSDAEFMGLATRIVSSFMLTQP